MMWLLSWLDLVLMQVTGWESAPVSSLARLLMIWLVAGFTTLMLPSSRPTQTSVPSSVYLRLNISPPHSIAFRILMFPSATGPP